eukprot:4316949-Amphidinium_carterae.1
MNVSPGGLWGGPVGKVQTFNAQALCKQQEIQEDACVHLGFVSWPIHVSVEGGNGKRHNALLGFSIFCVADRLLQHACGAGMLVGCAHQKLRRLAESGCSHSGEVVAHTPRDPDDETLAVSRRRHEYGDTLKRCL